ncbi:23S rRNA accumulation protein YceD [Thalassotalea euphylliae]|uniref:Large ribosomal RNA subunit accumulation protein YceD n=1 Tax=Thalassotalea euphylliae TaxID=1655234 RepID=A0A3E0TRB4_9GAMM|nr:23S rRNA accumulation protein YceD [Thalassotalea euphylliae]REL27191.1 23S rRNA accumulation protein YceD [Thalassotalea euphylliae]
MQNLKLPVTIDPYKSAQRRLECSGIFQLTEMNRLIDSCENTAEEIDVSFQFDVDELGLVVISGKGSASVGLICQRCNDELAHTLEIDFQFSPVKNAEGAADLPSYYDAIELDENGEVNLRELVEDELLLAIPLIPRHELDDCKGEADTTWGELPEELDKPNPFDVLKQLK